VSYQAKKAKPSRTESPVAREKSVKKTESFDEISERTGFTVDELHKMTVKEWREKISGPVKNPQTTLDLFPTEA
jgi:hypothetical protein